MIYGTSDNIHSRAHGGFHHAAVEYAEKYNRLLKQKLPPNELPKHPEDTICGVHLKNGNILLGKLISLDVNNNAVLELYSGEKKHIEGNSIIEIIPPQELEKKQLN